MTQAMHLDRNQLSALGGEGHRRPRRGMKRQLAEAGAQLGRVRLPPPGLEDASQDRAATSSSSPKWATTSSGSTWAAPRMQTREYQGVVQPLESFIRHRKGRRLPSTPVSCSAGLREIGNPTPRAGGLRARGVAYPGSEFAPQIRNRLKKLASATRRLAPRRRRLRRLTAVGRARILRRRVSDRARAFRLSHQPPAAPTSPSACARVRQGVLHPPRLPRRVRSDRRGGGGSPRCRPAHPPAPAIPARRCPHARSPGPARPHQAPRPRVPLASERAALQPTGRGWTAGARDLRRRASRRLPGRRWATDGRLGRPSPVQIARPRSAGVARRGAC